MTQKKKKEYLKETKVKNYELIEKKVSKSGHNGRLYTPLSWVGCNVAMLRLDKIDEEEDEE